MQKRDVKRNNALRYYTNWWKHTSVSHWKTPLPLITSSMQHQDLNHQDNLVKAADSWCMQTASKLGKQSSTQKVYIQHWTSYVRYDDDDDDGDV